MEAGGEATVRIEASPEAVYDLVADITRMPEWSPETYKADWRPGWTSAVSGARFRGWNKMGVLRWFTDPVIDVADRGKELAFTTGMFGRGRFTTWRFRMAPADGGGTDLTESWEEVGSIPVFSKLFVTDKRKEQLLSGMQQTLARIKAAAEAPQP
jgi:uncharacterized protein YndB with AHSA1/START domain